MNLLNLQQVHPEGLPVTSDLNVSQMNDITMLFRVWRKKSKRTNLGNLYFNLIL